MRVLILGGTGEASALIQALSDDHAITPILSLAGRTSAPVLPAIECRIGGFGGVMGLVKYLKNEKIEAIIDATHPFAAQMSENANLAAQQTALPHLILTRPPWQRQPGDTWQEVQSIEGCVNALPNAPHRIFLTLGRLYLKAFEAAPQHHYVVRSIDEASVSLPQVEFIRARPPFAFEQERHLLQEHHIEIVVSKNSGSAATYAKIAAARALNLPVVMWQPPPLPSANVAYTLQDALNWLTSHQAVLSERGDSSHV